MKVNEIMKEAQSFHTHPDQTGMERDGFKLSQDEEHEDDVIKIYHYITSPDGKQHFVDHSPYEMMDQGTFDMYIAFYKEHNRFPGRKDLHSRGPLRKEDLHQLVDTLHEAEGQLMPQKSNESTVRRLASQLVRTACKHFDGDGELVAAKKMARDFHRRLIANIETEYQNMKLRDVTEKDFSLSLHEAAVYNQEYKDVDDWSEDYAEDTGWSAQCPNCGSHEVHQDHGPAGKDRVMAVHYECEDCGHKSNWKGPDDSHAQKRYGHPSKYPHQYHDPDAK